MRRQTLGVIFGGRSVEHEVSIVTAHQAMAVLAEDHDVVPIYVTREGKWLSSPELNNLDVYKQERWDEVGEEAFIPPVAGYSGLLVPGGRIRGPRRIPLDVAIPAIHGTYGEDGTLQGLLELADIPYTCSGNIASGVGMDKIAMKAAFAAAGLPLVEHQVVTIEQLDAGTERVLAQLESSIGYPAFVKPARLGSSVGIGKATDRESLTEVLEVARQYDRRILVERSMDHCIEVNCSVLGGIGHEPRPSVCEQPVRAEEFLTFSDKYLRGSKGAKPREGMASQDRRIPAPINDALTIQVQDNALRAFAAIDAAGVARVDSFVDEDTGETWVMEINTMPGSFAFYLWEETGVPFKELMGILIDIALKTHEAKSKLLFTYESGMLAQSVGSKTGG